MFIDKLDGVFRDLVLAFQTAVDVFVHQVVEELHHLSAVFTHHREGNDRGLLADAGCTKLHALCQGEIVVEHESHLTTIIIFGIVLCVFANEETVVSGVDPLADIILALDLDVFLLVGNNELFIGVVVLGVAVCLGFQRHFFSVDDNVVSQPHGLGNLFVEFDGKR